MYLLDTALLLDLRNGAAGAEQAGAASGSALDNSAGLLAWAGGVARQSLFLAAMSLIELERAAIVARRRNRETGLIWRDWIDRQLLPAFEGRILAVDAAVARRQAELSLPAMRDAVLAATALVHNLTLATYHPDRYRSTRVRTFDPRGYEPALESDWREAARAGSGWLRSLFVRA